MAASVKDVFVQNFQHLKIDRALVKRIVQYEANFVTKNHDHIEFFGGKLLGVNPVKFLPQDRHRWFSEILQTHEEHLEPQLYALPSVNRDWKVSSDTMNLSCAWMVYAIKTSKDLSPEEKQRGMISTLLILQYKFLTSRLSQHFKFATDRDTAEATYASLNDKFLIRQFDNWRDLFVYWATEIIDPKSKHYNVITKFDDDEEIVYLLNDTQGRVRRMILNIYNVFMQVHQSDLRIRSESSVAEYDGESALKDKLHGVENYTRYLMDVVSDANTFIRPELVSVIENLAHTAPPKLIHATLLYLSQNAHLGSDNEIRTMLTDTMVHAFDYMLENRGFIRTHRHLADLLERLKGVYTSSRSTDPLLLKIRANMEKLVQKATGNTVDSVLASVRTAVLLYIVARTVTRQHFTTGSGALAATA